MYSSLDRALSGVAGVCSALLMVHCGDSAPPNQNEMSPSQNEMSDDPVDEAQDDGVLQIMPDAGTRLPAEAIVLGVCQVGSLNPGGTTCTGLEDVLACARDHCTVSECVNTCDGFLQCVQAAEDQCPATALCPNPQACLDCIAENLVCAWSGPCEGLFECGSTATDGACDKLDACCMLQPDGTACAGFAQASRMFSGDPGCDMLLHDEGFLSAYTSEVPCTR